MLTHAEFTTAVMQGTQKANSLAVAWSGGDVTAQDQGAEYLLTVEIARELWRAQVRKDGSGFVLLEVRPETILQSGPTKRGRLEHALRHGGRIDVALFDQHDSPIGLVEVKRISGDVAGLSKDAARIAAMMRRMSTLRYGALATIRVVKDKDISSITKKIETRLQAKLNSFVIHTAVSTSSACKLSDKQKWYSHALCFTLHNMDK
jgi:hypothetical protein